MRAEYIAGLFALAVAALGFWKDYQLRRRTEQFEREKLADEQRRVQDQTTQAAQQKVREYDLDILKMAMQKVPEWLISERDKAIIAKEKAEAKCEDLTQRLRDCEDGQRNGRKG